MIADKRSWIGDRTGLIEDTRTNFPARYDTLKAAMDAADEMTAKHFPHDCGRCGCATWMPVPPTHAVAH
jgi:hypothetical protein